MMPLNPLTLQQLARTFGTPLYVYDTNVIRNQIRALRQFDVIRFAQKANSNVHVLKLMKAEGVLVDAVSAGELKRALLAGYTGIGDPAGVVYTCDVLPEDALALVVKHDIPVNAGSIDMLNQLGRRHPGHRVWLRINPGFGHGHSQKATTGGAASKHGIWPTSLPEALASIDTHALTLVGAHMHIGSGSDFEHLKRVCDAMVSQLEIGNIDITSISAGGGLPIPYLPNDVTFDTNGFFNVWHSARRRIEALLGHAVSLEVEPGRFLMAEAGCLVAQVWATKRTNHHRFVLLDAGFNDLLRPALYGSHHELSVIHEGQAAEGTLRPTVVAGPLCESGDVFTQDGAGHIQPRPLPPAQVGDLVVFHDVGAYGATMSSTYNSRPLAAEVLVDGDHHQLIRRRQTIEDLLKLEGVS